MLLGLAKYAGWNYLPNLVTRQLLSFYHSAYPRLFGRPPPQPGTPEFARNYRMIYLLVVLGYLVYTFYDAATTVELNYYQILGVEPAADESTLKAASWRCGVGGAPQAAGNLAGSEDRGASTQWRSDIMCDA